MNCVIQSIKSKHFLLSKGMYKWDSVYSLNILCLHTCISQEWFIVKQILDLEVRTSPPLFFWHRPALGGCPASGGRHMATALLWGSTSDHYQAMTHHLARGYGQKITEAIFLGNSFYLLIRLVKHVWPSSVTLHIPLAIQNCSSLGSLSTQSWGAGKEEIHRASMRDDRRSVRW